MAGHQASCKLEQFFVSNSKYFRPMTAYLILAFKNPAQLSRLVSRVQNEHSVVFIHIDKKVDIVPFLFIARQHPNIRFVNRRFRVVWGGYSITEAIMTSMKEILEVDAFNHIVLMSGQDYPIRPIDEFQELLNAHQQKSFLHYEENTPESKWWSVAVNRYKHYFLSDFDFRGKRTVHKIVRRILPDRSFIYPHYRLYGGPGSTFCALSAAACEYIVRFMERDKNSRRFAQFTFASDEFWFQTILLNSHLKSSVINRALWYMDWDGTSKHPRILTMIDYFRITRSSHYFARKFDTEKNVDILDKLDAHAVALTTAHAEAR